MVGEQQASEQKSASSLRAQVLRDILCAIDADAALYFSAAITDERAVVSDAQVAGDSDAERLVDGLVGRRDVIGLEPLQNPEALDCRSFLEGSSSGTAFGSALAPFGVTDRIRLFVYDGRRFVGWVGALRFGPSRRPFGRADRRRLAPLVPSVTSTLLQADSLARGTVPVEPGFVALHLGGDVEYASREGEAWLRRPGFATALQRRMPFIDLEGGTAAIELAHCRFVPMLGQHPIFLVHLTVAQSIETSAVRLSPTQREVASFAASGATIAEIASAIGRKPETVRSHLRQAYTRLGVSNRVELARALAA